MIVLVVSYDGSGKSDDSDDGSGGGGGDNFSGSYDNGCGDFDAGDDGTGGSENRINGIDESDVGIDSDKFDVKSMVLVRLTIE